MAQLRGRGQILEKGKEKWLVRIFRGRDTNGKKQYSSKVVKGKKSDAQKYLTKKLNELDSGSFIEPSITSLGEYLKQWLFEIAQPKIRARTFEQYKWIVENYIGKSIGFHKLRELQAYQVQKFYGELQKKGLSARTVRYTHNVLSSALKQAVKWKMILQNPCDLCELPRQDKKEMKYFSPSEVNQFLSAAKENKWYSLFLLAIESGMRPEEYLGLQWKDVNFEQKVVAVRRALVWQKGGGFIFTEPKTARSRRSIPLSDSLISVLKSHRRNNLS